jgi:hypothetical protein
MSKVLKPFRLEESLIADIQSLADADDRSFSYTAAKLLRRAADEAKADAGMEATKPIPVVKETMTEAYPDGLNIMCWLMWVKFRRAAKFKKYKTDATMKKLAKMGDYDYQAAVVKNSIDNEYQGLFEVRGYAKHPKASQQLSPSERVAQACNVQAASFGFLSEVMVSDDRDVHRQVDQEEWIDTNVHLDCRDITAK